MSRLLQIPNRVVRGAIFVLLLAVATGFAFFDAQVGYEVTFSVLYLLPVAGATWFVGRTEGIIMAGICGILALGADIAVGHDYSQAWIPVYNALVLCGFFIVSAYALAHLRAALQHEARLAREDILTNIPNLRTFQERMPEALRDAAGENTPMTLGLVEISDISYINDRWGTKAGDHLLRVTAHSVQKHLRPRDLLCRIGGTTFAVILPETGQSTAQAFLEGLRTQVLAEMERYDRPVSIAIAAVAAERPTGDADALLERTGSLLRTIKLNGTAHPFEVVGERRVG